MNKEQRKEISNAFSDLDFTVEYITENLTLANDRRDYAERIEGVKEILEGIRDDEQEKFDNMPEGLQNSERGARLEENVGELDQAIEDLDAAATSARGDYPTNDDDLEEWASDLSASIDAAFSSVSEL